MRWLSINIQHCSEWKECIATITSISVIGSFFLLNDAEMLVVVLLRSDSSTRPEKKEVDSELVEFPLTLLYLTPA